MEIASGSLVRWLDPWKKRRIGLVLGYSSSHHGVGPRDDGYYEILVEGEIQWCHISNLGIINEAR